MKKLLIGVCAACAAAVSWAEEIDLTKLVREDGGAGISYAVTGSAAYDPVMAADKAFNGVIVALNDTTDRWYCNVKGGGSCTWEVLEGYSGGDGLRVRTVRVLASSAGRTPKKWTVVGINGTKEETLFSGSNVTWADATIEGKSVKLAELQLPEGALPYSKYRLEFALGEQYNYELQATEIQFWGEVSHEISAYALPRVATYDGQPQTPVFEVLAPRKTAVAREYALSEDGPWSTDVPEIVECGDYRVWCRFSAEGYEPIVKSAALTIVRDDLCALARAEGASAYAVDGKAVNASCACAFAWDGVINSGDTGRWYGGDNANGWTSFSFSDAFHPGEPVLVSGLSWRMQKDASTLPGRLPLKVGLYGSNDNGQNWTKITTLEKSAWGADDLVDDVYAKYWFFDAVESFRAYKVVDESSHNYSYAGEIQLLGKVGKFVSAKAEGWSGPYSGRSHAPKVTVFQPADEPTETTYSFAKDGPWSATPPVVDRKTKTVYCRVTAEGWEPWVGKAVIETGDPVSGDVELAAYSRQVAATETEPVYTVDSDGTTYYIAGSTVLCPSNAFNGTYYVNGQQDSDRWLRTSGVSATQPLSAVFKLADNFLAADKIWFKSYAFEIHSKVTSATGRSPTAWTVSVRNSDEDEWRTVETRSGVAWSADDLDYGLDANGVYRKVFTLEKPVRCRQFRFALTAPSVCHLSEIRLNCNIDHPKPGLMLIIW